MNYISSRSEVKGFISGDVMILGNTTVGTKTFIGRGSILGHPVNVTIETILSSKTFSLEEYDKLSSGSKIGSLNIIRSGTIIYETSKLSDRIRTGHNVLIREGSEIGYDTLIGSSTKLDGTVKVGNNVRIQSNVYLPHLTVIEDGVFIAPNVCFTNDLYPESKYIDGVVVEEDSIICANATIMAGVRICKNSVVAASSLVTKDVKPNTVVAGIPARLHSSRKEYDEKRRNRILKNS